MCCKRPTLDSGILNQRVDIQTRSLTTTGEPATTWSNLSHGTSVPCQVLSVSGGEKRRGQQIEANVTTLVTMRFRSDLDATMRLKYGDRYLNVVRAYDPDGSRVQTILQCKEIA